MAKGKRDDIGVGQYAHTNMSNKYLPNWESFWKKIMIIIAVKLSAKGVENIFF